MSLARAGRLPTWLLFALAVTAVFSRVCVLPRAHADTTVAGYTRDADDDDGEDAATDAIHHASCEALRSPQIRLPALGVMATALMLPLAPTPPRAASACALSRGSSPPLFLLYASLLI
jgi:hypothetical protein